jgi:hypothetical protein
MSGLALVVAGAYFSGYLAALAVPKAYFAFFGREHRTLAWVFVDFAYVALPFFLLSLAWCWLTLRPAASSIKEAAWFCFGGIVLGFAYEEWLSAIALRAAEDLPNPSSFFTYLWRVVPAWRALPNVLAFPVGLLAAFALVRRSNITRQAHTPAP